MRSIFVMVFLIPFVDMISVLLVIKPAILLQLISVFFGPFLVALLTSSEPRPFIFLIIAPLIRE